MTVFCCVEQLDTMSIALEKSFFQTLNEKQRRLFAALKATELGYFGVRQAAQQLGVHPRAIRAEQKELAALDETAETSARIRQSGGGRKKTRHPNRANRFIR